MARLLQTVPTTTQMTTGHITLYDKLSIRLLSLSGPLCQVSVLWNVNFYSPDFFSLGFARLRINGLFQGKEKEVRLSGKVNLEVSWRGRGNSVLVRIIFKLINHLGRSLRCSHVLFSHTVPCPAMDTWLLMYHYGPWFYCRCQSRENFSVKHLLRLDQISYFRKKQKVCLF